MGATGSGSSSTAGPGDSKQVVAQLDRDYVIGPTVAGELNYRIAWQYPGSSTAPLKGIGLRGDSVYTLDKQNFLTRVTIADGRKQWRVQVSDAVLDIMSLNVIGDRVYLTAGSEMLIFDALNGTQTGRWSLEKVAGTQPAEFGDFLIYGTRGGELVWLQRGMGFMWRAYAVGPSVKVPPAIRSGVVGAVDTTGVVIMLNAATATQIWSHRLLDPVVCKPVIGEDMVYVAGTDQTLYGYDLRSGRMLWHVLTESPLTSSPTLAGDKLYQQIPDHGLACYNAVPVDLPGGEFFWRNDKVTGNVILERKGDLFAWDAQTKRLAIVESTRGLSKSNLDLPQADFLIIGGASGDEIYAANKDGRVVRLVPRT